MTTYGYFGGERCQIVHVPGLPEPATLPDEIAGYDLAGYVGTLERRGRVVLGVRDGRYVMRCTYDTADAARTAMASFKSAASR